MPEAEHTPAGNLRYTERSGTARGRRRSMRSELILPVAGTMLVLLVIIIVMFFRINAVARHLNSLYETNIRISQMESTLTDLQDEMFRYLNVQNEESLQLIERSSESLRDAVALDDMTLSDSPIRLKELNINNLTDSYLALAERCVAEKNSHDVSAYHEDFGQMQKVYQYLLEQLGALDTLRFQANSQNFDILYQYLARLEVFMVIVLIAVTVFLVAILYQVIGTITEPLVRLAVRAEKISGGNLNLDPEEAQINDEVGTVTVAFNQMIVSINEYIRRIRENMALEMKMKEQEMSMENLLKDAQLKYYQAQINPHFLFNTLNAGQQLAMMEDAERTYEFLDHTASFFRYRLRKNGSEATLRDEIELIDDYMYIMNVRFAGEIHLDKKIDQRILDIAFPGMVLQPIVENALNHGLRNVDWEKHIWFTAQSMDGFAIITVRDNGAGIPKEKLARLQALLQQNQDAQDVQQEESAQPEEKEIRPMKIRRQRIWAMAWDL